MIKQSLNIVPSQPLSHDEQSRSHSRPLEAEDRHTRINQYENTKRFAIISVIILIAFIVAQSIIILVDRNGPFYDEAIYITAGLRSLQGKGVGDGYLVWFAGSLLWPMMAGIAYLVGGLFAVHFTTLLLSTLSLLAICLSTRNLFGAKVACFTILALVLNGPFFALAHLGVYDSPALAFTAISFWCLTELQRHQHRAWICASAISFALATISKYPIGLMLFPLLGLLFYLYQENRMTNIFLFLFIFAATFLSFYLSVQYQVGYWLAWSEANKPTFGATPFTITFDQIYFGLIPFILAIFGFLLTKKKPFAIFLLLSGLIWPAYHILSGNPVSDNKHVVFGFLFTYPLIGVLLTHLWEKRAFGKNIVSIIFVGLAILGTFQVYHLDATWPDIRPDATYLMQHVRPGDQLLINDAWPYTMYLYANHNITSPWDVFDTYRINNHESKIGLCDYNWFVDDNTWSANIVTQIKQCNSFFAVFQSTANVIGLGSHEQYVNYTVQTTIWENMNRTKTSPTPAMARPPGRAYTTYQLAPKPREQQPRENKRSNTL